MSPNMTKNSISCSSFPLDDKVPRPILRAMEGAKGFLHSSLLKVPWLWRMDPATVGNGGNSDGPEDFRIYGKALLRQIPSNGICIDCGEGWQPPDVRPDEEKKGSRCVCWANAALGVFLCSKYHPNNSVINGTAVPSFIRNYCRNRCRKFSVSNGIHITGPERISSNAQSGETILLKNIGQQDILAATTIGRDFGGRRRMDFGVPEWQRIKPSIFFSDFRDQYIIKKYIGKHWTATSKTPTLLLGKSYCDQEMQVIEHASSAKFDMQLCADPARRSSDHRIKSLAMLKRCEQKQNVDETSVAELDDAVGVPGSRVFIKSDAQSDYRIPAIIGSGQRWQTYEAVAGSKMANGDLVSNIDASARLRFNYDVTSSRSGSAAQFPLGSTSVSHIAGIQNSLQQPFKRCDDTELGIWDPVIVCDVGVQAG